MNKIEKLTLNTKAKYNEIKKTNYTSDTASQTTFAEDYKTTAQDLAKVGGFALSFDANNQTMAKAGKLSIPVALVERVKKMAGVILHTATAEKVQKASNNTTRKALAFAICKNATSHYKTIARTSDAKLYAEKAAVACWSTLLQAYFEILTNFGANALLQKIGGGIEIVTPSDITKMVEKMTAKAKAERVAKSQARKNAKEQATAKAKAKAETTAKAEKQAPQGKKKTSTGKGKA